MAEFVVKINDSSSFRDGDPISAWSRRAIRKFWAERICWPRDVQTGRKIAGRLEETQPLLESWFQTVKQYRWDRVSRTEIKRTNQWTGDELVYGSTPVPDPDKGGVLIHCHVEQWLQARDRQGVYPLFGSEGAERFYIGDGLSDYSDSKMTVAWNLIETHTPLREADHQRMKPGNRSKRVHLYLRTEDFDDAIAETLVAEDRDAQGALINQRLRTCDWRDVLGLTSRQKADVEDRSITVDLRETQYSRATITREKTTGERGR